ncbi:hypothetical protein LEMLEM_LOCUS20606 [Lemmus lemmus]
MSNLLKMGVLTGMVVHSCNPSTREVKVGEAGVQDQPWLHRKFKDSLGYMKTCPKKAKESIW